MLNEKVTSEVKDDLAVIQISNGDQNVIDIEVLMGLAQGVSSAISEEHVKAVLIRSSGSNFSTGYDGSCKRLRDNSWLLTVFDAASAVYNMIRSSGKPFFMAVGGKCLGLGFELALSGDFIGIAENSKIGIPDFQYGLPSLMVPPSIMENVIGNRRTFLKLLTSEIISGTEALDNGIGDVNISDRDDSLKWVQNKLERLNLQIFTIQKQQRFPDPSIFREYRSFIKSYDTSVVRIKELEAYRSLV
jgi:enoyl-CoA hydratase